MNLREAILASSSPNDSGCWILKRPVHPFGYGSINAGGRRYAAHRASYEAWHGLIPKGLSVLHRCDVASCVNPDHLYAGTQYQNMQDRKAAGKFYPQHGELNYCAKLTEQDVRDIRKLCGYLWQSQIAVLYGISRTNVEAIHVRRSWRHVA